MIFDDHWKTPCPANLKTLKPSQPEVPARLRHRHRIRQPAAGAGRRRRRRHLAQEAGEPQFLLDWRLKAFRHWQTMQEPTWAHVHYKPIDYQDISYYSAPRAPANAPKSLDEVDPKLLATYAKLGIPLHERARLAGVAVDAVFDSVSVATTFKDKLGKAGVIFCSFSDAVRDHPRSSSAISARWCPPPTISSRR
jgi:Fe-S cluster assembly scaffold protein SufB